MLVRLLIGRATLAGSQDMGDEIDVPADEAVRMIDAGQAEAVRRVTPEKAVKRTKPEKASKK